MKAADPEAINHVEHCANSISSSKASPDDPICALPDWLCRYALSRGRLASVQYKAGQMEDLIKTSLSPVTPPTETATFFIPYLGEVSTINGRLFRKACPKFGRKISARRRINL